MEKKKILYIDMDDTVADFFTYARSAPGVVDESRMFQKDFFYNLRVIPGAKAAIFLLKRKFDIWILTQPLAELPESYMDKARWIATHFPDLNRKIIMTQDKGLHIGDFLVDDNEKKWKGPFEKNGGKFIHYPYCENVRELWDDKMHIAYWEMITRQLMKE